MVPLITALRAAAPGVDLRFAPKPDKGVEPLREGPVDLDIGVAGTSGPEMRIRLLFRDHFVGAVRAGHPLPGGAITAQTYAACDHVVVSRRGALKGPVDDALAQQGLTRRIAVIVPGFPDAIRLARHSDLVALVPRSCLWNERGLVSFPCLSPRPKSSFRPCGTRVSTPIRRIAGCVRRYRPCAARSWQKPSRCRLDAVQNGQPAPSPVIAHARLRDQDR
jgi:DNA-binding transcriptional LysR family regulator